jgi:hypothetical protein
MHSSAPTLGSNVLDLAASIAVKHVTLESTLDDGTLLRKELLGGREDATERSYSEGMLFQVLREPRNSRRIPNSDGRPNEAPGAVPTSHVGLSGAERIELIHATGKLPREKLRTAHRREFVIPPPEKCDHLTRSPSAL